VDKKLKEFFIRPPLTPHALAAPQVPHWGKNTDIFMME